MKRRVALAVAALTLAGLLARLLIYPQSLFGDELSTLYLVDGRSLREVFSAVSSDAEISPPLYFLLAWVTTHLGDAPQLVRLPALVSGVALIPLVYQLATRVANRRAGYLAAGLAALSPFMVFLSTTGRAYSLMLLLLVGSTLCLLEARAKGGWWWTAYGLLVAGAMYSHYTAVFVLAAQFGWAIWAVPGSRRPLTIATVVAAVAFLPWVPQLLADLDSPTTVVLEALQGSGFAAKRVALEQWFAGQPIVPPHDLPGTPVLALMAAAALVAGAVAGRRLWRQRADSGEPVPDGFLLVALAAAATPVLVGLMSLFGHDLFSARNLSASWPYLAILISCLVVSSGRVVAIVTGIVLLAGSAFGLARMVGDFGNPDYRAAASVIECAATPGDNLVDVISPAATPVPLTPLSSELELPRGVGIYNLDLPLGEPPFLPLTPKADPDRLLARALRTAGSGRVFVVGLGTGVEPGTRAEFREGEIELPAGWRVTARRSFSGMGPVKLTVVRSRGGSADPAGPQAKAENQAEHAQTEAERDCVAAGD